jgi:ubiquinone/menaquinone biosynthesis C-methylase UbiE
MLSSVRKQAGLILFNRLVLPPSKTSRRLQRGSEDYGHAYLYDQIFKGSGFDERAVLRWTPKGSRCLDLGGGTGRISFGLVQSGHEVTLVDHSCSMLDQALRKRALLSSSVAKRWELRRQSLTDLDLRGTYDRVFILSNVMAHLVSLAEMQTALGQLRNYLIPESEVVVDVHYAKYWERTATWGKNIWKYCADVRQEKLRARVWRRTSATSVRYQIRWEHAVSHNCVHYHHLQSPIFVMPASHWYRLFEKAGFRIENVWGDFDEGPLRESCPVLVLKMKINRTPSRL